MGKKTNYNDIPVEFCSNMRCCSLAIIDDDGMGYCDDCGSMKISKAHIDKWKEFYFMAHGKDFLNENK